MHIIQQRKCTKKEQSKGKIPLLFFNKIAIRRKNLKEKFNFPLFFFSPLRHKVRYKTLRIRHSFRQKSCRIRNSSRIWRNWRTGTGKMLARGLCPRGWIFIYLLLNPSLSTFNKGRQLHSLLL